MEHTAFHEGLANDEADHVHGGITAIRHCLPWLLANAGHHLYEAKETVMANTVMGARNRMGLCMGAPNIAGVMDEAPLCHALSVLLPTMMG
eukprot:1149430-Pelagomonas_calceolata.AAC.1